jgi:hypothetical protein
MRKDLGKATFSVAISTKTGSTFTSKEKEDGEDFRISRQHLWPVYHSWLMFLAAGSLGRRAGLQAEPKTKSNEGKTKAA